MRLVYFSPVRWDSYEQRPHYFVRHFLASGGREVVWIDPYIARLPRPSDRHLLGGPGRARVLWLERPDGLTVRHVRALPIDPLPGGAALNRTLFWRETLRTLADRSPSMDTIVGIGRPTALALAALDVLRATWSFYDAMDMFPEFYGGLSRRHTGLTEAAIAGRVDRIFASAEALANKFRPLGRRVTLLRNAYDMALLPPVDAVNDGDRRGLGFLGCLGRWFDWPLTLRVADAIKPLPVTLVGPRPVPGPAHLPDNVRWRPECHQAGTIAHLATFAAGLIPFTADRLTAGVDPIKYYQYRGVGLPVLTTSFGEMAPRTEADDTFFLDRGTDIGAVVRSALARRSAPARTAAFRIANSWQARFDAADVWSHR